MTQTSPLLPTY